ncbi:MAG: hypothetical protein J7M32_11785, partial [Deltaproteobacteria bacterium]|nr:hypothetical protein [Deltaproteobacteria bacterium]
KRPARRPGAEEKFFCPGTRFAVIPLIIEMILSFVLRINNNHFRGQVNRIAGFFRRPNARRAEDKDF